MGEILADTGAGLQSINDGGFYLGGPLFVSELRVDVAGGCFNESERGAIAVTDGSFDEGLKFIRLRDVFSGREEIVEIVTQLFAMLAFRQEGVGIGPGRWRMHQDDRFGFNAQHAVIWQDVELMDPVAEEIEMRGRMGRRDGRNAKRETALLIVLHGAQADFVVTFRNRTIVLKFGDVQELIAIHVSSRNTF